MKKGKTPSKAIRHMFNTFATKGAVNTPAYQRISDKYYILLKDLFQDTEHSALVQARKEALAGEKEKREKEKDNFVTLCKQIENRIWEKS